MVDLFVKSISPEKKARSFYLVFACIVAAFFLFSTGGCTGEQLHAPEAVKGIIDLKNWDFAKKDQVPLDGEWAVFWNQLLTPQEIALPADTGRRRFYQIPGTWNNISEKDPPLSGMGYATFVLEILMPDKTVPLSVHIPEVLTAYTLWADGTVISKRGQVGENAQTSQPEFRPDIVSLPVHGEKITLTLQVSNFHHRKGGPWTSIVLGSSRNMNTAATMRLFVNIFLVGSMVMIGLYHFSIFFLGARYNSSIYFGIFCFLISVRSLVTNERYLHIIFPDLSWLVLMRIEYLAFYLAVPVFALFIHSVFPKEFHKKVVYLTCILSAVFSGFVLNSDVKLFSHTTQAYQAFTFLLAVYLFFVFVAAYKNRREGTIVNLIGFLFLFATIINDILYVNEVIITVSLIPVGMFFFIFSQAFMLSFIYSASFKKVELQKEELGRTNEALGKEIQINKTLQSNLVQSHEKFQKSRIALILGLAKLAEYRDEDTGAHLKRMREFSILLAIGLSKKAKYKAYVTREYIDDIYQSSILHDIGKVGIKDAILLKPGKLTAEEFEQIKLHPTIGGDALTAIESEFREKSFLTLGKKIAYSHHEKWDGSGYPKGLKGDQIPLSARIVALADVYDALTSERPYKKAFSHEKAKGIIVEGKGAHFDPEIVDLFLELEDQFRKVREQFPD